MKKFSIFFREYQSAPKKRDLISYSFSFNFIFNITHIVFSIEKQIMSAIEKSLSFHRSHFPNATYEKKNIWINFSFDTQSFLRVVDGEQKLHIVPKCRAPPPPPFEMLLRHGLCLNIGEISKELTLTRNMK